MKILVTGHTGFIGKAIYGYGQRKGYDMYGLSRSKSNVDKTVTYDIVFCAAAETNRQVYENSIVSALTDTFMDTVRLLSEYSYQKVMYVSTVDVNLASYDRYAFAKKITEDFIRVYLWNSNKKYCIVRLNPTYGPGQKLQPKRNVIATFLRSDKPVIYGDGNQTRRFTYVEDVVEALYEIALGTLSDVTIELGTDEITSIGKLADMVMNLKNKTSLSDGLKKTYDSVLSDVRG